MGRPERAALYISLHRGETAPAWLESAGMPARLVAADGKVLRVGAWPEAPQG